MPMPLGGIGSGDFLEMSGHVHLFYVMTRNTLGTLTADAFTQANPPVVTTPANVSTTLSGISKVGVLGGTVAFTRPDVGNGFVGGPVAPAGVYNIGIKPLGVFLNDSLGNAFENTPGVASGKGPFVCGSGSTIGVDIFETQQQIGGAANLTYAVGDNIYASVNGLLTNRLEDAYEYNVIGQNSIEFVTRIGVCRVAPDANNNLLVLDLRV